MTKRGSRPGKSATELLAELEADPEWVARRNERDRAMEEKKTALRIAQQPLLEELASVGWRVASVWDLVGTRAPYPEAIPVLLKHLPRPYPLPIRDGIARALAVPEAHRGWAQLAQEFEKETDSTSKSGVSGMKWALALALAAASTDAELDQVLRWVSDPALGQDRAPLLNALARSRDPRSLDKLHELVKDPSLKEDAEKALRRRTRKRT
jgi:hypothetical protein